MTSIHTTATKAQEYSFIFFSLFSACNKWCYFLQILKSSMHPTSPMEANSIRKSKILPSISRHCLPRADILQTEGGKKVSMLLWAHQYEFYTFSWSRREQVILWEASSAQAGTGIRGSSSYSVYSFCLFIPHVSPDIKLGFQVKTHRF